MKKEKYSKFDLVLFYFALIIFGVMSSYFILFVGIGL
jgi:hypothetical protein